MISNSARRRNLGPSSFLLEFHDFSIRRVRRSDLKQSAVAGGRESAGRNALRQKATSSSIRLPSSRKAHFALWSGIGFDTSIMKMPLRVAAPVLARTSAQAGMPVPKKIFGGNAMMPSTSRLSAIALRMAPSAFPRKRTPSGRITAARPVRFRLWAGGGLCRTHPKPPLSAWRSLHQESAGPHSRSEDSSTACRRQTCNCRGNPEDARPPV